MLRSYYPYMSCGKTVEIRGVQFVLVEKPDSDGNCRAVPKRRYGEYLHGSYEDMRTVICLADAIPKDEIEVRGADNQLLFSIPDFGKIVVNGKVVQLSYIDGSLFCIVGEESGFSTFSTYYLAELMGSGVNIAPYMAEASA